MRQPVSLAVAVREALGTVPEGLRLAALEHEVRLWQEGVARFGANLASAGRATLDLQGGVALAWKLYRADGYQPVAALVAGTIAGLIGHTLPPPFDPDGEEAPPGVLAPLAGGGSPPSAAGAEAAVDG